MGYQQQSTWGVSAFLSLRFTSSQFKGDLFLPSAEHHQQPTKCLEKQRKPLLTPWRPSETRWSTRRTPKRQLPIWRRVFRTASPSSTRFSRPEITRSSKSARRSRTPSTTRRRSWRQRPWVWRMPRSSSWSSRKRSQLSSVDSLFSTTISPVPTAVSKSKAPSWPRLLLQQKLWRFKERPLRVNHLSMTSAWTLWRNKLKLPVKWHSDLLEMQRKLQENSL